MKYSFPTVPGLYVGYAVKQTPSVSCSSEGKIDFIHHSFRVHFSQRYFIKKNIFQILYASVNLINVFAY
jgi:hypothetical protein